MRHGRGPDLTDDTALDPTLKPQSCTSGKTWDLLDSRSVAGGETCAYGIWCLGALPIPALRCAIPTRHLRVLFNASSIHHAMPLSRELTVVPPPRYSNAVHAVERHG